MLTYAISRSETTCTVEAATHDSAALIIAKLLHGPQARVRRLTGSAGTDGRFQVYASLNDHIAMGPGFFVRLLTPTEGSNE